MIAADVEGMDNLTVLYLNNNGIKDMGSSLKALTSLTLLDVSSNQLTKVTASSLKIVVLEQRKSVCIHCPELPPGP